MLWIVRYLFCVKSVAGQIYRRQRTLFGGRHCGEVNKYFWRVHTNSSGVNFATKQWRLSVFVDLFSRRTERKDRSQCFADRARNPKLDYTRPPRYLHNKTMSSQVHRHVLYTIRTCPLVRYNGRVTITTTIIIILSSRIFCGRRKGLTAVEINHTGRAASLLLAH